MRQSLIRGPDGNVPARLSSPLSRALSRGILLVTVVAPAAALSALPVLGASPGMPAAVPGRPFATSPGEKSRPALQESQSQESPDPPDLRYEYATEEKALEEIFPEASVFVLQMRTLQPEPRRQLEDRLRRRLPDEPMRTFLAFDDVGGFQGYGVVTEEIGKYRPITFLVGVEPGLEVREVQVLVYRESRGSEVRRRRFLSQYEGKGPDATLRIHRDILNVSGATLSVRAMNAGVKRVLAVLEAVYGHTPPTLSEASAAADKILSDGAAP